jgi:hypothetical protein
MVIRPDVEAVAEITALDVTALFEPTRRGGYPAGLGLDGRVSMPPHICLII